MIKTLKYILGPKANEMGRPFKEVLECISDDKKFSYLEQQLNKYVSRKGLRADTKLKELPSKTEFLELCKNKFFIQDPDVYLKAYKKIVFSAFNNYQNNDREWKSLRFIYNTSPLPVTPLEPSNIANTKGLKVFKLSKDFNYPLISYRIDENEITKILQLAKKILDPYTYENRIKGLLLNNQTHYLIDEIFKWLKWDVCPNNTVWNNSTFEDFNKYIKFIDMSDLSENCRSIIPKHPNFTFRADEWQNTKIYDQKITNIEELESALNNYSIFIKKLTK